MGDGAESEQTRVSPPGWNPDPYQRHEIRYWNGTAWTEHVGDAGSTGQDPVGTAGEATPMAPAAPTLVGQTNGVRAGPMPRWAAAGTGPGAATGHVAAPRLPAPSSYRPPRPPGAFDPSIIGKPIGKLAPPWYKAGWFWVVVVAVIVLAAAPVTYFALRDGPARIDAAPAAPTPAGWQNVTTDRYRLAIPPGWSSQDVSQAEMADAADQIAGREPAAAQAIRDASASDVVQGPGTVAIDPVTRDNVIVLPYRALSGDPRDHRAELEQAFRSSAPGITDLESKAADVHGFPAVTLNVTYTLLGVSVSGVSTVIQTGDHVYQLTVTSRSADRANMLSAAILPTFAPR